MPQAVWKGTVIAEADKTVVIEGSHYFPMDSIRKEHFQESSTTTHCHWKGHANYFDIVVDGEVNNDAAWFYAEPLEAAADIKNHVAFWKGVEVKE